MKTSADPWALAQMPVRRRDANGPRAIELGDVHGESGARRLAEACAHLAPSHRTAVIYVLHHAVLTITDVVLAPAVVGIEIEPSPRQLGFVLDNKGVPAGSWVAADLTWSTTETAADAIRHRAAKPAGRLLAPVIEVVSRLAVEQHKVIAELAADATARAGLRLIQSAGTSNRRAVDETAQLLDAAGLGGVTLHALEVVADAGPPIASLVPRRCCVLERQLNGHSCPTCPLRGSDEDRRQTVARWLMDLTDDEFHAEVGRERVRGS